MKEVTFTKTKDTLVAKNIEWDIDYDEVYEVLDNLKLEDAAEKLEVPFDRYIRMTTGERHDYAYDKFRHCPGGLYDFLRLPESVDIPSELCEKDEDEITNWLSDTYGYCISSYKIEGR